MATGLRTIGSAANRFTSNPSATLKDRRSISGSFTLSVGPGAFGRPLGSGLGSAAKANDPKQRHSDNAASGRPMGGRIFIRVCPWE